MALTPIKRIAVNFLPAFALSRLVRLRAWWRAPHVRAGSTEAVFTQIKKKNLWHNAESLSGAGSSLSFTAELRQWLPELFSKYSIRKFVDIPCGDFAWMQHVAMGETEYIGGDIVEELIEANQAKFGNSHRRFLHLDLAKGPLPEGDLILVKDCFIHLSHDLIRSSLRNIYRAGYKYLLTTTYPSQTRNVNILTGDTWSLNLRLPPFNLPAPIDQKCEGSEGVLDKFIALWPREALRPFAD